MPPIISIVGKSKSGKTTFIEKLVRELKSRGYRVATIKHAPQGMTFDESDKDSWRHIQAGSEATAITSPNKIVLIKPVAQDLTLEEIVRFLGEDYDIILAEGFKQSSAPKIEVHRREVGPPLSTVRKLIAIVTDEPLETKTRQFSLQDIKGLADLLEEGFIKPQRERISLYINNVSIVLTAWPKEVITNVILAMASCLKGVGEVRSLEVFLRRGSRK
ncbi:MAG: molybdopterin-guanine dinucleotide biosynthesis protein B [Dehalococcoidia bacterium]|nr:MAG: molybdopterin-guanine dinucleotide biosynthesis protein B [Dehalococcoidia bacterium]